MISMRALRIEQTRLVANTRVVLAGVALAATYFDPTQPSRLPHFAYLLLSLYLAYALAVALIRGLYDRPRRPIAEFEHLIDLLVFTVLIYMTEGMTSPFFPLFTYALLVAHLHWGWRGTLATAAAIVLVFLTKLLEPDPDVGYILVRCTYLAVLAALIAWIGERQEAFHRKVAQIAAWPSPSYGADQPSLGPLLGYAAGVIGAPSALLVRPDAERSLLHLTRWNEGRLNRLKIPLAGPPPIRLPGVTTRSLLVSRSGRSWSVLISDSEGIRPGEGPVIDENFAKEYAPGAVLILPIHDDARRAHLILSGKPSFTPDDLVVGEIVASHVSSHLKELRLLERLREGAMMEERIRLARDLHDGVLQSLTAARMQLEGVRRLLPPDSAGADRLARVQASIERDQRGLREFIKELKPAVWEAGPPLRPILDALERWTRDLSERWDVSMDWTVAPQDLSAPPDTIYQLRRIIEEATANAKKHGGGRNIALSIKASSSGLDLQITDDGRGFGPEGANVIPQNLNERVESLGGTLTVRSTPGKTTLNIALPTTHVGFAHAYSSDHSR